MVAGVTAGAVERTPTFREKTEAKVALDLAVGVAEGGFVVGVVGLGLIPIAWMVE